MKPALLLSCLGLLFSCSALADNCQHATNQTDLNACAATEFHSADQHLNTTYQNVLAMANATQQPLLKHAQTAWIALRDADCALLSSAAEGGSVQTMIHSQCLTDKTRDRDAFLASLTQCDEGDLSCPFRQ